MPKVDKEDCAFVTGLVGEFGLISNDLSVERTGWELVGIARKLQRINERRCNEVMDDATEARMDKREARLEKRAAELAMGLGCVGFESAGDPRGAALHLLLPSGRSNSFDGKSWVV